MAKKQTKIEKLKSKHEFETLDEENGYDWLHRNIKFAKMNPIESAREMAICECEKQYDTDPEDEIHKTWEERKQDCKNGADKAFNDAKKIEKEQKLKAIEKELNKRGYIKNEEIEKELKKKGLIE